MRRGQRGEANLAITCAKPHNTLYYYCMRFLYSARSDLQYDCTILYRYYCTVVQYCNYGVYRYFYSTVLYSLYNTGAFCGS